MFFHAVVGNNTTTVLQTRGGQKFLMRRRTKRMARVLGREQVLNPDLEAFQVLVIDSPLEGRVSPKYLAMSEIRSRFPKLVIQRSAQEHVDFIRFFFGEKHAQTLILRSPRLDKLREVYDGSQPAADVAKFIDQLTQVSQPLWIWSLCGRLFVVDVSFFFSYLGEW